MASEPLGIVVGLAVEARLARMLARRLPAHMAIGGGGEAGAAAAARRLLQGGARGLISFGLAGGLDPALAAGTLLCPETVLTEAARFTTDAALAARLGLDRAGSMLGGGEILASVAEKARAFRETGAVAVDLESGAVARTAIEAGLPFAVLRAIADPATRALPRAALAAMDAAGRVRPLHLLAALGRRPGEVGPLLALAREAGLARRALLVASARVPAGRV